MLQIKDLHKSFGLNTLFDGASLQMSAGERLGLVGRNAHGKSTLLKIILSELQISFPKNHKACRFSDKVSSLKKY